MYHYLCTKNTFFLHLFRHFEIHYYCVYSICHVKRGTGKKKICHFRGTKTNIQNNV